MATETYSPLKMGGKKEEELVQTFITQRNDARLYFTNVIKPRLDRSYKLYIADNTDRAKEIKQWQANIAIPYIQAVVETLKPRILDARPDFTVQGRTQEDQIKANKIQYLADYSWEKSRGDNVAELLTSSSLIYGTGYMQVSWKKDKRKLKFLETKDLDKKKYKWVEKEEIFYDAPYVEWVDNYELWYDWHNVEGVSKQYWYRRKLLVKAEIKRRYPGADKKRLNIAFATSANDLEDYASVRSEVKLAHEKITKGSDYRKSGSGLTGNIYKDSENGGIKMHEVFECIKPFEDEYSVWVNDVPVLKGAKMPNPYDFKESFYIGVPYLKVPGEYEGYGLPMTLENPQIMLNMVKNQRLDAMTLNIHKMWIVNPLANINKEELVSRPFGIVYSTDPNGAREVQMSDIKPSAYKEEELLKSDMRYSSGVDDSSMGVGGSASSATEVRHLRESTLERVRMFVNHLGDAYATMMRYWISMFRQFATKSMVIRVAGENGEDIFPLIEKDDLLGEFDFKATVIPSIAGQNDVKKKQDMDLFQLLVTMPFIDPEKLTSKMLFDWNWNLDSIKKVEEPLPPMPEEGGEMMPPSVGGARVSEDVARRALEKLGGVSTGQAVGDGKSLFAEMAAPVNLLKTGGAIPPTPRGVPTSNPRGMNRSGKVNTNIPIRETASVEGNLMNRVNNIQR